MPSRHSQPLERPAQRPAQRPVVATVVCDGAMPFEFAVTAEVFGVDRSELATPWYEWKLCSASGKTLHTAAGFDIRTPYGLDDLATADTIIVAPSGSRSYPPRLLAELRAAHERGARIASLCTGAFVLAAAGLLDGRSATTHWMHAQELQTTYPMLDIDPAVLYVDAGNVLTSAGTAASIDLCLHLVRNDFGADVANQVARRMVVPPHRDGGQAQYVEQPIDQSAGHDLFAATLEWVEANISTDLTVNDLAARAAMSPRTFARRFSASTGTTPHHWITNQRVQLAQRLLESTDRSIEHIATECGLGSATNLRNHFQRIVHTTPSQYRGTFRLARSA